MKAHESKDSRLYLNFPPIPSTDTTAAKIARRLEWIRMGIYGMQAQKGAERLMAAPTPSPASNFNLQVELKQDGGVIIVPAKTNGVDKAPAPK